MMVIDLCPMKTTCSIYLFFVLLNPTIFSFVSAESSMKYTVSGNSMSPTLVAGD